MKYLINKHTHTHVKQWLEFTDVTLGRDSMPVADLPVAGVAHKIKAKFFHGGFSYIGFFLF